MQAGDLRHRIEIQRIIKRREADKSIRTEYRTIKTVWAKVNGLYGREWWEARKYGGSASKQSFPQLLFSILQSIKAHIVFIDFITSRIRQQDQRICKSQIGIDRCTGRNHILCTIQKIR